MLSRSAGAWSRRGSDFGGDARALAAALLGYGLNPGARVAVLGFEGHDVLCAEIAALVAGATVVSLDPSLSHEQLAAALATTAASQAIASDEDQLARLLALRPDLPALDLVVLMRARPSERKPAALLADAAIEVGRAALAAEPSLLRDAAVDAGTPSEAVIVFDGSAPPRTTSRAELTHAAGELSSKLRIMRGRSILMALPRGRAERMAVAVAVAASGATLLLADPGERPDAGLDVQRADAVLLSPEALLRLHQEWTRDMARRSWIGRATTRWALRQGADPSRAGWKRGLAERLALRDLRGKLGGRVERIDVAADGPIARSSETESFFEAVGLPVRYLASGGSPLAR